MKASERYKGKIWPGMRHCVAGQPFHYELEIEYCHVGVQPLLRLFVPLQLSQKDALALSFELIDVLEKYGIDIGATYGE